MQLPIDIKNKNMMSNNSKSKIGRENKILKKKKH